MLELELSVLLKTPKSFFDTRKGPKKPIPQDMLDYLVQDLRLSDNKFDRVLIYSFNQRTRCLRFYIRSQPLSKVTSLSNYQRC